MEAGHSCIILILLLSVFIPFSDNLCPRYMSDFLKLYTYRASILVPLPWVFRKHDDFIEIDETPIELKVTKTGF